MVFVPEIGSIVFHKPSKLFCKVIEYKSPESYSCEYGDNVSDDLEVGLMKIQFEDEFYNENWSNRWWFTDNIYFDFIGSEQDKLIFLLTVDINYG